MNQLYKCLLCGVRSLFYSPIPSTNTDAKDDPEPNARDVGDEVRVSRTVHERDQRNHGERPGHGGLLNYTRIKLLVRLLF